MLAHIRAEAYTQMRLVACFRGKVSMTGFGTFETSDFILVRIVIDRTPSIKNI